jgi:hypothetical protein
MIYNHSHVSNFNKVPELLMDEVSYARELYYWLRCEAEKPDQVYLWLYDGTFKASHNHTEYFYRVV